MLFLINVLAIKVMSFSRVPMHFHSQHAEGGILFFIINEIDC